MIRAVARVCVWWCFWHAQVPAAADVEPFRIVTKPCFHLGVRPAADAVDEWTVTAQVSYCTPW